MRSQGSTSSTAESSSPLFQQSPAGVPAFVPELDQQQGQHPGVPPTSNPFSLGTGAKSSVRTDKLLQWPIFEEALSSLQRYPFLNFRQEQDYTYLEEGLYQSDDYSGGQHVRGLATSMNISSERTAVEPLVDQFFSQVHVKNPILDRQAVKQHCQEYYEHGPQFHLRTCLVLLICALGSIAPRFQPGKALREEDLGESPRKFDEAERLRKGYCYYAAAEKRLSAAMVKPSSLGVQCLCLAG